MSTDTELHDLTVHFDGPDEKRRYYVNCSTCGDLPLGFDTHPSPEQIESAHTFEDCGFLFCDGEVPNGGGIEEYGQFYCNEDCIQGAAELQHEINLGTGYFDDAIKARIQELRNK